MINQLPTFKNAISSIESSGNYSAIGVPTKYGRALGKYQVMEAFLPDWSKQYLGRLVSRDEFLKSPKLQEQWADARFTDLFGKYGNWEDVASVHFSGRPLAQAGNAKDALGTTVPKYVASVRQFLSSPNPKAQSPLFVDKAETPKADSRLLAQNARDVLTQKAFVPVVSGILGALKAKEQAPVQQVQTPVQPIQATQVPLPTVEVQEITRSLAPRRFKQPEPLFVDA